MAFSIHSATKSALRNLARSRILDLKKARVRVNVLSLGPIWTPALLEYAGSYPAQQQGVLEYPQPQKNSPAGTALLEKIETAAHGAHRATVLH